MFDKIFELLDKISKLLDKKVKIFDKIQKKNLIEFSLCQVIRLIMTYNYNSDNIFSMF